jgi:hypothetical protein
MPRDEQMLSEDLRMVKIIVRDLRRKIVLLERDHYQQKSFLSMLLNLINIFIKRSY